MKQLGGIGFAKPTFHWTEQLQEIDEGAMHVTIKLCGGGDQTTRTSKVSRLDEGSRATSSK